MKDKNGKEIVSPLDTLEEDENWDDFDQAFLDGIEDDDYPNIPSEEFWERLKV